MGDDEQRESLGSGQQALQTEGGMPEFPPA